jgi:hypothetical protein
VIQILRLSEAGRRGGKGEEDGAKRSGHARLIRTNGLGATVTIGFRRRIC